MRRRRLLPACAMVALLIAGCASAPPAPVASGPSTTNCGIALCEDTPATPSTTPSTASGNVAGSGWVDETGNLNGLASECGNLMLLSARPNQGGVIAGVAQQGLWLSTDGSATWTRLGQGSGSAKITNRPSSITYDPSAPDTFWESGLYNGGGAYETTNDGVTFKQLGDLTHSDDVSINLSDPARRTLLSGRHESSKLFRSTDGGATWDDISASLPPGIGYTSSPLVINAQVFLLGTTNGAASGVFRSTDGGTSWTRVYTGGVAGQALVIPSNGTIYWLLASGEGLVRSTDGGVTWQTVLGPGQVSINAVNLIALPDGRLATLGTTVIVSADGGLTWQPVGPVLPYAPNGLIYDAFDRAFFIWRFDCVGSGPDPVKPGSIMRWNFDYTTQ